MRVDLNPVEPPMAEIVHLLGEVGAGTDYGSGLLVPGACQVYWKVPIVETGHNLHQAEAETGFGRNPIDLVEHSHCQPGHCFQA